MVGSQLSQAAGSSGHLIAREDMPIHDMSAFHDRSLQQDYYRVVKLRPGVYEVAFAYSNPLDRDTKLDRIAAATGLDMSGG